MAGRRVWLLAIFILAGLVPVSVGAQNDWELAASLGLGKALDVAWHPSGETFAVSTESGVYIYDLALREQAAHLNFVSVDDLAWSPDGALLTLALDHQLYVSEAEIDLYAIPDADAPFAWSPDGQTLAYTTKNAVIRLMDRTTRRSAVVFSEHYRPITDMYAMSSTLAGLAWSPDGKSIASVDDSGQLFIWDTATGATQEQVNDFVIGSDASLQWVGTDILGFSSDYFDATLKNYNVTTGGVGTLTLNTAEYEALTTSVYNATGTLLAAMTNKNYIELYRKDGATLNQVFRRHLSGMDADKVEDTEWWTVYPGFTEWNPAQDYLLTGNESEIVLWRVDGETLERVGSLDNFTGQVAALDFEPNGDHLAATYGVQSMNGDIVDGSLRVWDMQKHKVAWRTPWGGGSRVSLDWDDDGTLLTGVDNGQCTFEIWDAVTHERTTCIWKVLGSRAIAQPHGGLFLALGEGVLYDSAQPLTDESPVYVFPNGVVANMGYPTGWAWSPDGQEVVTTFWDGESVLGVMDMTTAEMVRPLENSREYVMTMRYESNTVIAYSPDGRWIAVGEGWFTMDRNLTRYNHDVAIYDAATGKLVQKLQGHTNGIVALAWSPDNTELVTAGMDGTVLVWSLASGEFTPLSSFSRIADMPTQVAWSPKGDLIAVGMYYGRINVFKR